MNKFALWVLIFVAAGTAFYMSFRNSVDMASIVECDDGNVLCASVLPDSAGALRVRIDYANTRKTLSGEAGRAAFPSPFTVLLIDSEKRVVARKNLTEADENVFAPETFPRGEKYLWLGFPQLRADGKPASLLIRNPYYGKN